MSALLFYLLKVNIAIVMFYLLYRLTFYRDTLLMARRIYLLMSIFVSLFYPFLSINRIGPLQLPLNIFVSPQVVLPELVVTPDQPHFNPMILIPVGYGLIMTILFIRMCIQIFSIVRWKLRGSKKQIQHRSVIVLNDKIAPFSFFNLIFMNPALHSEFETNQILAHEYTHVRQWHSLDVLISELMIIFFWINPATWLLRREIRQNLEFLADNKVLQSGFEAQSYQYHLLQLSYQVPKNELANNFNISPLKKRIMKMNQQKTAKSGIWKYSLVIPATFILILSVNAQTVVQKAQSALKGSQENNKVTIEQKENSGSSTTLFAQNTGSKSTIKFVAPTIKKKNEAYEVVEKMPQFPGGDKALMDFLGKNIKYPEDAIAQGIQGRVFCRFIVGVDGKITKAEILRGVYPSLDKEAIRVIKSMPQWVPGEQGGKKVAVWYTLPVSYRLDGDKKSSTLKVSSNDLPLSGLGATEKPLIVVDGIADPQVDPSKIDPKQIKSMDVLKGESATALYGERGKNGVLIITTNK